MSMFKKAITILALALVTGSAIAGEDTLVWTTVGSAGHVDEADQDLYSVSNALISTSSHANFGDRLNVRYNISGEVASLVGPFYMITSKRLEARMSNPGYSGYARIYLKEYNRRYGTTITRMALQTPALSLPDGFRRRRVLDNASWAFDFENCSYFLDVSMSKGYTGTSPAIGSIALTAYGFNIWG